MSALKRLEKQKEKEIELSPVKYTSTFALSEISSNETDNDNGEWTREDKIDVAKACFNLISAVMGAGILGLPRAFANSGWYGLIVLTVVTVVQGYTGMLVSYCLLAFPSVNTYKDLGFAVAGKWGKYIVLGSQMVQCFGVSILYLVLAGSNMDSLFSFWEGNHQIVFTAIAVAIVLPTVFFRTMKEVAIVSIFGVCSSILAAFFIFGASVSNPIDNVVYTTPNVESLSGAVATFIFSYGTHALFPSVQRSMTHQKRFNKAILISFPLIYSVYIMISVGAFWSYGCFLDSSVLNNLSKNAIYYIVTSFVTLHVIVGYTLFMNPVFHLAEYSLNIGFEQPKLLPVSATSLTYLNESNDGARDFQSKVPVPFTSSERVKSAVLRSVLLGVTFFLAILLPFFGEIMDFLGGSAITIISIIIPIWFYTKIYWKELSWYRIAIHVFIALAGAVIGGYATYNAAVNIVNNASKYELFGAVEGTVNTGGQYCSA
eukprot:Nk52_evm17s265 gene=Nk52_evmTU17s265